MAIRLSDINKALAAKGVQERLVKGKGYFYFNGGEASSWYSSTVDNYSLNQSTLEQYLEAWKRLSGNDTFPKESE